MKEIVSDSLKEAQQQQKTWYDQIASEREMDPGEEVLVLVTRLKSIILSF